MTIRLLPRNLFCGLCAALLILFGYARRGKRRAFEEGSITPIYFHKPNRRLFTRCILWLKRNGYSLISARELIDALQNKKTVPRGSVWISLDDGYKEWLADVLPVVHQYKFPVTLFIPSGIVNGNGLFPWLHNPDYPVRTEIITPTPDKKICREALTPDELRQIASWPQVQVGGHTVSHALTPYCTREALEFEIGECKQELEAITNSPVNCFAYPAGRLDGREARVLKEYGFAMAATTEPSFVTRNTNLLHVPRLCVPDNVTFPEAICNMVGVWQPFLKPIKDLVSRIRGSDPRSPELPLSAPGPGSAIGTGAGSMPE